MIWLISFGLALIAAMYLTTPLLPAKTQQQKLYISLFITLFIGASLGTYRLIGTPKPPQVQNQNSPTQTPLSQNPLSQDPLTQGQQVTQEQIISMVDGLAARLANDPEDPEGWTRLLRSRIVLKDIVNLIQDHKAMSEVYKTRPEIIAKISQDSGFNDLAAQLIEAP
ncbi:MAG: hypothetical protein ABJG88_09400 [Litorimonas sp.]